MARAPAVCTRSVRGAVHAACRAEGVTADAGGGGGGGAAHVKRVAHLRDARCVPAQRLVEGRRLLRRVVSRAHGAGRAADREAGRRAIVRCTQSVQEVGVGATAGWGQSPRGAAHREHAIRVCDAGRVPAHQRLVEGRRALPRVASRARGVRGSGASCVRAGWRGRRQATVRCAPAQRARGTERDSADGGHTEGVRGWARLKHCIHPHDAGGVPAQRLVEGRRVLCRGSQKQGTRCGAS